MNKRRRRSNERFGDDASWALHFWRRALRHGQFTWNWDGPFGRHRLRNDFALPQQGKCVNLNELAMKGYFR